MYDTYAHDFETFLTATNEKAVLLREIEKDLERYKPQTLLDIGAGNGDISIQISRKVQTYKAIEKNPRFVERLRTNRIDVTEGTFPLKLSSLYDFVLISHTLAYTDSNIESFVKKAWDVTQPHGILSIITYKTNANDDWKRLMKTLGGNFEIKNSDGYELLYTQLSSLGKVTERTITTQVRTNSPEDMIDALAFVASNGIVEKKAAFMRATPLLRMILETKYRENNSYFFPFQHYFVTTRKI